MKYVDPTGEWFGFDDVFTGPIDEIVVIAGLTLYGAFLIYNSETNKNFTDAFAESFNSNLEKIKIILSKKKTNSSSEEGVSTDEKPSSKTPLGAGRRGALREAKRNSRVPTSQPPEQQIPNYDKKGDKQTGKQYKYRDSAGNPVTIRDDSKGHTFPDNSSQNRGPHFNDEAGNHYDY